MVGLIALSILALFQGEASAPKESDFYRIETLTMPQEVVLEVSGLAMLPDGRPMVCTRRGEVFILENAYSENPDDIVPHLYADGLQEPLGLLMHEEWIYVVQRGELSRMRDLDGDDRVDEIETVCDDWRISGNYHEYNFGPRLDHDGNLWITTNKPFGEEPFGRADWRGFALRITPDGEMLPTCSGLRSPAGVEVAPWGDVFYTDNQGEWCGANKLAHLEPGDFHGHPWGIASCELPLWPYGPVAEVPGGKLLPVVKRSRPELKLPAVWFPYDKMGKSPAGMVWDQSKGDFGPFAGQLFVADQHHASIMRVFLEEVNGHWQGACFPFREDFQCGNLRLAWGADGSLFCGQTNRGWGSKGSATEGLERLHWTGKVPFEVREMRAQPDGFTLHFTKPVAADEAGDRDSYSLESYTYLLHAAYGSNEVDRRELSIERVEVAANGLSARLYTDGLRAGYVHELHLGGVQSQAGEALLHSEAYYTLIEIPGRTEYLGREIARTMHWKGADWLLRETRQDEENTKLLLKSLKLEPGLTVADLGCGNGYLSLAMAPLLGGAGHIYGVDIQPEFLTMLAERCEAAGVEIIEPVLGTLTDPLLPPDSCDVVVMLDVYHELSHPEHTLRHVRKALKEGGRLILVEFRAEDPDVPIKPEHKMMRAQVLKELAANGFTLSESFDGLPMQHLLTFVSSGD